MDHAMMFNLIKNKHLKQILIIYILDLNAVVEAMIEKSHSGHYVCLNCNRTFTNRKDAKRHAEVHLDISHTCIACNKVCKTRNALATRYTRYHPSEVVSPWTMK